MEHAPFVINVETNRNAFHVLAYMARLALFRADKQTQWDELRKAPRRLLRNESPQKEGEHWVSTAYQVIQEVFESPVATRNEPTFVLPDLPPQPPADYAAIANVEARPHYLQSRLLSDGDT